MATRVDSPEYRQHYNWGWRYSQGSGATLDYLDDKYRGRPSEHDAAEDGYLDHGTGRAKWHLLHCPNHGGSNEPGKCGEG